MTEIIGLPMAYNIPQVPAAQVRTDEQPDKIRQNSLQSSLLQSDEQAGRGGQDNKRTTAAPGKVPLTFKKAESFDYIGMDKNLEKLDIRKAISDMRKDKILEEYQYFVGGKPDLEYDGDIDGTVFLK